MTLTVSMYADEGEETVESELEVYGNAHEFPAAVLIDEQEEKRLGHVEKMLGLYCVQLHRDSLVFAHSLISSVEGEACGLHGHMRHFKAERVLLSNCGDTRRVCKAQG